MPLAALAAAGISAGLAAAAGRAGCPLPLLDKTPATPAATAAIRMTSPMIMIMTYAGDLRYWLTRADHGARRRAGSARQASDPARVRHHNRHL